MQIFALKENMKPLLVLLSVFILSACVTRLTQGHFLYAFSGRVALCAMLLFTALGHFMFTKGMEMMLPDFVPFKTIVVYFSGVLEIMAAAALLFPETKVYAGWFLIAFFILILPANIYAAVKHVDYKTATYTASGPIYLWFRIPLQLLFILWTYFFAVKN